MLTKLNYEALILLHKARWYYIEFYVPIIAITISSLMLIILVAVNTYFK